jgi:hypothetical protein
VGAFNLSLLGKWCWRLVNERDGLWYSVLKARYGEWGGRIKEGDRRSSNWWRMVCRVRDGIGEGVGSWFEDNLRRVVGNCRNTLFWFDCWVGDMPLRLKYHRLFDLAVRKECSVEEMWRLGWSDGGRAWVWRRRLFAWEEESVRECSLLLHNIVLQDNVTDKWRWLLDPLHGYSVRESYKFFAHSGADVDRSCVDEVWHRQIPLKVSLLVWRLLLNRLPTKDNLWRRGILNSYDILCSAGGCDKTESTSHLFLECVTSRELWNNVCTWLGISLVMPLHLRHHLLQFSKMAGWSRSSHLFFTTIWFASIWVLWKERNYRVFQHTASNSVALIEKVKLYTFLWLKSKHASFCYSFTDWWKHPTLCMGGQVHSL